MARRSSSPRRSRRADRRVRGRRRSRRTRAPARGYARGARRGPAPTGRRAMRPRGDRRTRSRLPARPSRRSLEHHCAASIVPGEPHINSSDGLPAFAAHDVQQPLLQPLGRRERVRDEEDPRLAHPERRHDAVLGEVGLRAIPLRQASTPPPPSPVRVPADRRAGAHPAPRSPRRAEVEGRAPSERRLALLLVERMRLPQESSANAPSVSATIAPIAARARSTSQALR